MGIISLMSMTKTAMKKELGCDGCTMGADWITASVQKPGFCKMNEKFVYCPIFGEMPYEWDKFEKKARYCFVDDRQPVDIDQVE